MIDRSVLPFPQLLLSWWSALPSPPSRDLVLGEDSTFLRKSREREELRREERWREERERERASERGRGRRRPWMRRLGHDASCIWVSIKTTGNGSWLIYLFYGYGFCCFGSLGFCLFLCVVGFSESSLSRLIWFLCMRFEALDLETPHSCRFGNLLTTLETHLQLWILQAFRLQILT